MTNLPSQTGARLAPFSILVYVRQAAALLLATVALLFAVHGAQAQDGALAQTDISGPRGSGAFGEKVYTLPNGNFVVVDSLFDAGRAQDVGAVSLYDGATLALISRLTGSTALDKVGSGGVVVLTNDNFVVTSPSWHNGPEADAGAVTWVNGLTGISGAVSSLNSLVGSTANDQVGSSGVTALSNGNYVVNSRNWADVGAVTWGNGAGGTVGVVSASNSLVVSTANDVVGNFGVTALTNGNYVVDSPYWDGAAADVGAVTWGNGAGGTVGVVSASNSLVGSTTNDAVGFGGVTALPNGNYVVRSHKWDGAAADVGAVTWGNGASGTVGAVSASNSLVGSTAGDAAGLLGGVTALTNGNYVVHIPYWDGVAADVGAVTWGNGASGTVGAVSASNSLVGSTASDQVGNYGVTALTNGNYVVSSRDWDGAELDVGAVTWGNGSSGTVGVVSASNSLVGSTANDRVGYGGVTALTNGNYVVFSREWDGAAADVGAVTWGNGAGGTIGIVSPSNSLVSSTANDRVGYGGVTALTNGNYVVNTYPWDGAATDVGAVTWGNGASGTVGVVSASNSLVGSTTSDAVGFGGVTALTNGNYVVDGLYWDDAAADVGAVTWGNGTGGTVGVVSASNSLVGSTANDLVGLGSVTALANGNYVVNSPYWDGAAVDGGAVSLGNGRIGTSGPVASTNSVLGAAAAGGIRMVYAFDTVHQALVVGRPADNIVSVAALRCAGRSL